MPSGRKPVQDEATQAWAMLHGRSDDFHDLVQWKAGLRLLRDADGVDKDKLAYAEAIVDARLDALISGIAPRTQKRKLTLREIPAQRVAGMNENELTLESDLMLRLLADNDYEFILSVPVGSRENAPLREIIIPLQDALCITGSEVSSPFKFKLASIEEGDVMWNMVFGQGLIQTEVADSASSSVSLGSTNPIPVPNTTFGASTIPSDSYITSVSTPQSRPTQQAFFYKVWCGRCKTYFAYTLAPMATSFDDVKCDKCHNTVIRKQNRNVDSVTQGN